MLYYIYFTNGGQPRESLLPVWHSLYSAAGGTDKSATAPAITECGGGWYRFEISFGRTPWDDTTEDLLGVIDGGDVLPDAERYKPVCISLRGLALARLAHKAVQDKETGNVEIYDTDNVSKELLLEFADIDGATTRSIKAPDNP